MFVKTRVARDYFRIRRKFWVKLAPDRPKSKRLQESRGIAKVGVGHRSTNKVIQLLIIDNPDSLWDHLSYFL